MNKASVARRYARALLELLDATTVEPARTCLVGLGQAIAQSIDLRHLVASPAFRAEEKLAVLTALADTLHAPPLMKNFLTQLVTGNRAIFLPDIADAFVALMDQTKGTRHVTVTSASPLSPADQERVRARLREVLKREVDVTFQAEPSLLGGLQIRIGSTLYDSSLRSRLTAMQTILTKE